MLIHTWLHSFSAPHSLTSVRIQANYDYKSILLMYVNLDFKITIIMYIPSHVFSSSINLNPDLQIHSAIPSSLSWQRCPHSKSSHVTSTGKGSSLRVVTNGGGTVVLEEGNVIAEDVARGVTSASSVIEEDGCVWKTTFVVISTSVSAGVSLYVVVSGALVEVVGTSSGDVVALNNA